MWPPAPDSGFQDCAAQGDGICLDGETCIETTAKGSGTTQVCAAADCTDPVADCPVVPETGDAPAACQDIDGAGGDECVLDCSGGETCPDGAVCTDDGFCSYEIPAFFEGFQSGDIPAGWTTHDVDGLVVSEDLPITVDEAWVATDFFSPTGEFWATATSWYDPVGTSDDWLISPAITLGDTATLSWLAFTPSAMYPDGYQVYVVPTTVTEFTDFIGDGDPIAFLALDEGVIPSAAPVFEIAAEEADPQSRSVDIGALAGQEVHLAFRNNTEDGVVILIDDIAIYE